MVFGTFRFAADLVLGDSIMTDWIGELVQAVVLSVGCAGVRSGRSGNGVKFFGSCGGRLVCQGSI